MPSYEVFQQIVGEVHAHSLGVDASLVESWVRDAWYQCMRERTWSFLRRKYQIIIPAPYSTGTCTLDPDSTTVVFAGATLTSSMTGRQFRRSTSDPIHEIVSVDPVAGTATIHPSPAYLTSTAASQPYTILTAYITPPADFLAWLSVTNMARRRRLVLHVNQEMLDFHDPKRARTGPPICLSGIDWTQTYGGRVHPVVRVHGTGATPIATGFYTGQADALYVVKITLGGARGTATYAAYKNTTLLTSGTTSEAPTELTGGITLEWPTGTYVIDAIFVIRVDAESHASSPRYELWPHPTEATVLSALYSGWHPEVDDPGFTLPKPFTTDVVKLAALARMARYPGTADKPNPYSQIGRAGALEEQLSGVGGILMQLGSTDDYIITTSVNDGLDSLPDEILPWASGRLPRLQSEDDPSLYY